MPKQNNYYLRQLSGRGEVYSQEDYEELKKHEGEFRYSDFKKWNMAKLLRTSKVLRDEAFRRAEEFETSVQTENVPLSPAYSRLEERNVTWVKNRDRLKFGSKKIEVINNIIQTLTFLDDETSTLEGWRHSLEKLSKKINVPIETLMNRERSKDFYELYYKVTDYLTKEGVNWKPSETMTELHKAIQEDNASVDFSDENSVRRVKNRVKRRLMGNYEREREQEQEEQEATNISSFFTTKK